MLLLNRKSNNIIINSVWSFLYIVAFTTIVQNISEELDKLFALPFGYVNFYTITKNTEKKIATDNIRPRK